jgi:integrase
LQPGAEALVENLMTDWLKLHVSNLLDPVRYKNSVGHWAKFFDREHAAGRLVGAVTVADLTPQLQARFRAWRAESGVGGHTISRDLAALRGALNWAWKNQRLEHAPFIADVPPHQKAPARDRVLAFEEIAAILDQCTGLPEREHLIRFIVVELGTAGRPDAVLELTDKNIDLKLGLIDPNHEGKAHARKRRAIVPIARHVLPWVNGVKGKLIKYRVPIAKKNRVPGGPEFFERETKSVKTVWKAVCKDAGVKGASPKTLRHTMLTWLAMRGVPKEQRSALAGHVARDTTARNYEHLSPDYLRAAIDHIDAFFVELAKHTNAHLRYANDTEIEAAEAA